MNELVLFAGSGGGTLGSLLLGSRPVCFVEKEEYCARVLVGRMRDGILPHAPIWGDIRTFDGTPFAGKVDLISGGFPCQDISRANTRPNAGARRGLDGDKSGLWKHFARVVCEVRSPFVFVENSPDLVSFGLGRVLGDLAHLGYDARWGCFSAGAMGAFHERERLWIFAYSDRERLQGLRKEIRAELQSPGFRGEKVWPWAYESMPPGVAYGVARGMDRLKAVGNGQVPILAARVFAMFVDDILRGVPDVP